MYFVTVESPSNIAIVKYWGKKGVQLPLNPSLSFTLKNSKTITTVKVDSENDPCLELYFENTINEKFKNKILLKKDFLEQEFEWLFKSKVIIESQNTFPHSTGIASSASSMSALSVALVEIDEKIHGRCENKMERISRIARVLSGSASRSVFPTAAAWGKAPAYLDTIFSDEYAVGVDQYIHPKFKNLQNAILIVDSNEKSVSSSAGHELMNFHPHRDSRINHANKNFVDLLHVLTAGDFAEFARISEVEALDLHAMMMTSHPSFILLKPNSLSIIEKIRSARSSQKIEMTFTIDAGPNIHLLYSKEFSSDVKKFIDDEFIKNKLVHSVIYDEVGSGTKVLS